MSVSRTKPLVEAPPPATELWHYTLHNIGDRMNLGVPHPLDRRYAIDQLLDLHAVGERPHYDELKAYVDELWRAWPGVRRMVRGVWRTILRNPHHRFRGAKLPSRFATLDMLARENGLRPIEDRLADVAALALADFHETATRNPDFESYLQAHQTLEAAISAISRFRDTRLGLRSLGACWETGTRDVSLDEIYEWHRLRRKYGAPG